MRTSKETFTSKEERKCGYYIHVEIKLDARVIEHNSGRAQV